MIFFLRRIALTEISFYISPFPRYTKLICLRLFLKLQSYGYYCTVEEDIHTFLLRMLPVFRNDTEIRLKGCVITNILHIFYNYNISVCMLL